MPLKVVVVGAGVGGVSIAGYLAKEGYEVEVYEKNEFSGGRCSLIHKDGFRFDQGPSLLLMPEVFERAFRDLGEEMKNHIDLLKCDPNYVLHFGFDGPGHVKRLTLQTDLSKMKVELEAIEKGSFPNFLEFLKESSFHYDISASEVLDKMFINWYDLFTLSNLSMAFKLHVLDKLYSRVSSYFISTQLRQAFSFQTMYMGMSPYDAPATYSLLQYTELTDGIWYPRGGFHKIVEKLQEISTVKFGAKFTYSKGVQKIVCENERVAGVELDDGTFVNADIVVSNVDLVTTYRKLLPAGDPYVKQLEKLKLTSSTFSFYWCMKQKISQLEGHNIFLAGDYKESFDVIFENLELPNDPSFYVHVPSRIDSSCAPEGKDALMILVPVGHLNDNENDTRDWDSVLKRARDAVIDVLSERLGIDNFEDLIESEEVNTPATWRDRFGLWKGSALGLTHSIFQVLWFRPSNQHRTLKNLYFVGASTHPGTGVPVILSGARALSKIICNDSKNCKTGQEIGNANYSTSTILAMLSLLLLGIAFQIYRISFLLPTAYQDLQHAFSILFGI